MSYKKFISIVLVVLISVCLFADAPDPDPKRFDQEINTFIQWDKKNSFVENSVLFVGSSSIRMWPSAVSFPKLSVINRGFGGSHISDVLYYYNTVVKKYNPSKIVFYCGDNDIASQKSIDQVVSDYQEFVVKVKSDFSKIKIYYIPIKPSIARWEMWHAMDKTNLTIKEICDKDKRMFYVDIATPMITENGQPDETLFLDDGLHLNEKGYTVWNNVLSNYLK